MKSFLVPVRACPSEFRVATDPGMQRGKGSNRLPGKGGGRESLLPRRVRRVQSGRHAHYH